MFFTYLLIIVLMLLLINGKNYLRACYMAFKLPGPPNCLPLIGHAMLVSKSRQLEQIGNEMFQLYGPIMKVWVGIIPFFFIIEPRHLQIVIGNNKCSTKNMFYTFLHNFIGDGLITNSGEKWKLHRKLLQPYFNLNKLQCFLDSFHNCGDKLLQSLDSGNKDVNFAHYSNRYVLDVLQETVLGISEQKDNDTPFRKGKLLVPYRIARPWLLFDWIFKLTRSAQSETKQKEVLQDYTRQVLEDRERVASTTNNYMDMMINISKTNSEFTADDIVNETSTLMLAGQDSVGAALAFTLFYLAKHQHVQNKVMDELHAIFEGFERRETFEDLSNMKYLEQCIKETMRLCPPVPIISRKLLSDTSFGEKYHFPKGTNIFVSPFVTHRMPHIFHDPLKFDPDRFSAENVAKIHPFAYIPFSAGPRNCIGYKFALLEMKTVISKILRRYHISLVPGKEDLVLTYRITLRAQGGIWLRFQPRSKINSS